MTVAEAMSRAHEWRVVNHMYAECVVCGDILNRDLSDETSGSSRFKTCLGACIRCGGFGFCRPEKNPPDALVSCEWCTKRAAGQ